MLHYITTYCLVLFSCRIDSTLLVCKLFLSYREMAVKLEAFRTVWCSNLMHLIMIFILNRSEQKKKMKFWNYSWNIMRYAGLCMIDEMRSSKPFQTCGSLQLVVTHLIILKIIMEEKERKLLLSKFKDYCLSEYIRTMSS